MTFAARCYRVRTGDPTLLRERIREKYPALVVQAVSEEVAENESLVEMIAGQTVHAVSTQNLLAKRPEIDLLLRLAGTTQISEAIKASGAAKGKAFLMVLAGDGKAMSRFTAPAGWRRLRRRGLAREDLARIEKAALLNVSKA